MARVPALALGTVQFGLPYGLAGATMPVREDDVRTILRRAADAGVSRLDTAAAYGDIEERLAGLVGDLPFSVVSKIPSLPANLGPIERIDFVRQAIARSQARLGQLLVGILFHDPAPLLGPNGPGLWAAAKEECDRLGIALGVSGYDPAEVARLHANYDLAMAQLPASALDQRVRQAGEMPFELTLRSLFLQGLLLLEKEEAARRVPAGMVSTARWRQWCASRDLPPLDAALAIAKSFVADYAVVGVDTPAQWDEIAAAWARADAMSEPDLAVEEPGVIDPRYWCEKD